MVLNVVGSSPTSHPEKEKLQLRSFSFFSIRHTPALIKQNQPCPIILPENPKRNHADFASKEAGMPKNGAVEI